MIVDTASPEETAALGRRLGALCGAGTVLALAGELGSGKTCFAKGVAGGLGIPERDVTSPTFVLMNRHAGRIPLAHLDLYRLDAVDLAALGFYDVRDEGVVIVEWADKADPPMLGDHLRIDFAQTGERGRRLILHARGERSAALLGALNLSP